MRFFFVKAEFSFEILTFGYSLLNNMPALTRVTLP